jgi:SAM-dependent methyltransferase
MATAPSTALPREMQAHTYSIMYEEEEKHWWFVGRRRILREFVHGALNGTRGNARILDVGCGTGANLEMLREFGDAEGIDVSDEALDFCRARGLSNVRKGDAERLPHSDATFDLVTALDVVEHLDDHAGLREIWRVLKPGGQALVFVPAFMFLWGVQDDISHHRRRYTLDSLTGAAQAAGFRVKRATYANITFFVPVAIGRALMRVTGLKPRSENEINIAALNGVFGRLFGAERFWLRRRRFPFGVSIIAVLEKPSAA